MLLKFKSYRTSKGKLLRSLKPMRKEYFASCINPIIATKRGIPESKARQMQYLQSDEVQQFLNRIGEPLDNYAEEIVIATHQMNKTKLLRLFPTLSTPKFTKLVNAIIAEVRDIPNIQAARKRYLLPVEVEAFLQRIGEELPTVAINSI